MGYSYDCDANQEIIDKIDPLICMDLPIFFDQPIVKSCYSKLNLKMSSDDSLAWIKNVQLTGCVVSSEQLLDGSSLLSTKLLEYLTPKMPDFYKPHLKPAIEACYGDLQETRKHRLETYVMKSIETGDGGATSSPVASFILECVYGELMKFSSVVARSKDCGMLKDHVEECGTW